MFLALAVLAASLTALATPVSKAFSAEAAAAQEEKGEDTPRVVAVLVSVGTTENVREQFKNVPNLDLLEVNGMPMIMHVYDTLRRSRFVEKIVVVAAPEVEEKLRFGTYPNTSFVVDQGDAAENVRLGIDQVSKGDLILFIPSDLVLVTPEGLDSLIKRAMREEADILFPIVSRDVCEEKYPEERRTYANFSDGQYTGAHVEFVRPDVFLDNPDEVEAEKDNLYGIYHMRKNTLGVARFLGVKLTLKYIFGLLSPEDVEQHVFEKYRVTAKILYWDDPDLSTDLSEPGDILMVERTLNQRALAHSQAPERDRENTSCMNVRNDA